MFPTITDHTAADGTVDYAAFDAEVAEYLENRRRVALILAYADHATPDSFLTAGEKWDAERLAYAA